MKAICWYGKKDVRVEDVPEPKLLTKRDAILKTTLTAICGSDLHLYHGEIPGMKEGDILGHEFMGEVVEVGTEVPNLKKGDRVVVPCCIACGNCFFCQNGMTALCDNSNPNSGGANGSGAAGMFGYSHLFGGYAGGQAQYVRVPFADFGPMKVPDSVPDEQALFLTDIFPTGYTAAENCNIQPGDVIAVWGCGPVGQFAIRSAFLLGAERVIAIDSVSSRLNLAAEAGAEPVDFSRSDVSEQLTQLTAGRGPDACIDAAGIAAPDALHQAIQACRKGGTISIPGAWAGQVDRFPLGTVFIKGLTFKTGPTNVHATMKPLLQRIEKDEINPSFVISHRLPLEDGPKAYGLFDARDACTKVVLKP